MNTHKKALRIFLVIAGILALPTLSSAIRIEDPKTETDLMLMGLGVLRVNYTSVEGNSITFKDSDRGLPTYFSNSSKVDFLASGTFYHGYELEGYLHYRDITYDYEPNLDFYFKIKRDKNFISIGDHKDGMFTDTLFTRFEPEFRGATIHLEDDNYGLEVFGGAVRGNQTQDEIDADGTSGPYYVSNFPIMVGSETVYVRVRNKNNSSIIIKNDKQQKGVDYSIDYETGKIKFTYPLDSTDFSGNPVSIVVIYQYDDPTGGFSRYVSGGRLWVLPHEYVRLGLTYLTEGPVEDTIGDSWDRRAQIYGTDLLVDNKKNFYLNAEFAVSDIPDSGDEKNFAYRGNFKYSPTEKLSLWGGYYRVDKDFSTFGTTNFDIDKIIKDVRFETPFDFESGTEIYDLNPEVDYGLGTDEESWGIGGEYAFTPISVLNAGYREIHDNVPYDVTLARTTTRDAYASYRYTPTDGFNYFVGTQWIRSFDDLAAKYTNTETYRLILGTKGPLGSTHITGPIKIEAAYVYDDIRDFVDKTGNERTHYLLARIDIMPRDDLKLFLEKDEMLISGRGSDGTALWGDATWVGMDYNRKRFRAEVLYKFLREQDYILNREVTRENLVSTIFRYKPFDTVAFRVKLELSQKEDASSLPKTTEVNYLTEAEIAWDIRPDLTLSVTYSLEGNRDISAGAADETFDDEAAVYIEYAPESGDLSLYGEYRFERSYLKTYPLSSEQTLTNTYIVGGRYQFLPDWEVVCGYKYAGTTGALDSHKMDGFGEVGWSLSKYLKLSLGYERQDYYDRDDTDSNFTADIGYLKATGTF